MGSQGNPDPRDKAHTHRGTFLPMARRRSISPHSNMLPETFRPSTNVFDQKTIQPRPWQNDGGAEGAPEEVSREASWCSDKPVPPEQTTTYQNTETSVKDAIKSIAKVTAEVVVKILETGVLEYIPIPGLGILAKGLVRIWQVVKEISNNRLRLLRLTQRCAVLLLNIKRDVESAGERVQVSCRNALDTLEGAFDKVLQLAQSQMHTPFLQRLLGGGNMDEKFEECDEELNSSLRLFSLTVQFNTMKLVLETTDNLRQQNEELMLQNNQLYNMFTLSSSPQIRASVNRSPSPSYGFPESSERRLSISESASVNPPDIRRSVSLNQSGSVHRPTASSLKKQVVQKTVSEAHPTSGLARSARKPSSRLVKEGKRDHGEDPIEKIKQHQRLQNEFDKQSDVEDMREIIRETLAEGKDSFVIKLFQIDSKDFPQAIMVLEHELREYHAGRRQLPAEDSQIQQELIQRGVDAMKRTTRDEDMVRPEWTINKFTITELETIGYGSFSTVRKAVWNEQTVAIKILSPKTKRSVFENEMRIWKALVHPNILPLFGASNATEEPLFFVSLYAQHGNLVDFLQAIRQRDLEGVFGPMLKEQSTPVGQPRKRTSAQSVGMREQAHHNRWNVERSPQEGELERFYTLPLSKSESKFNHCHILKEGDLYGFMIDIAKGMEYLHENGVLHGDLKASNVLVNDDLTCILSDFGQSERRNDIYRASGWTPKGTARWKAPELLNGSEMGLTPAIDVYAYSITCIEILSMGNIPWGSAEDGTLASMIVAQNLRPPVPPDFRHPGLETFLETLWQKDPVHRPEFKTIVVDLERLVQAFDEGALHDVRRRMSQSAVSLQSVSNMSPLSMDNISVLSSPFSSEPNRPYFPAWASSNFNDLQLTPGSPDSNKTQPSHYGGSMPMPIPMIPGRSRQGYEAIESPRFSMAEFDAAGFSGSPVSASSAFPSAATIQPSHIQRRPPLEEEHSFVRVEYDDLRVSPVKVDLRDLAFEETYQRIQHDFDRSLRIPLWNPVAVEIGDVGYMNKHTRAFVTLFNAFEPIYASVNAEISIPSMMGFGDPCKKHVKISTPKSLRKLFRTFSYKVEVEAGRPVAHCFCENPDWHYLEDTRSPQAWFKASVDSIVDLHGFRHQLEKENLLLVVGALQASRYSLLASHNHTTGTIEFTANSAKKGRPWGSFSSISSRGRSEEVVFGSRISEASSSHRALFLTALHFPRNSTEPAFK
ncbi:hypothetical protein FA15DRAFT_677985 [Coprinopsis marcescibilis]|uniref:Protein kinase domain-containing protein n=1 Tax=Coprinopsis marcescibilis TaxID=230819 RepID=A0A5C3L8Z0_COPMA|nr:hypothetical protein FA15DRAFT_677985 [Coprinopsis marcescibilis]